MALKTKIYETPEMSVFSLILEQCIAASAYSLDLLEDMYGNEIYDEEF